MLLLLSRAVVWVDKSGARRQVVVSEATASQVAEWAEFGVKLDRDDASKLEREEITGAKLLEKAGFGQKDIYEWLLGTQSRPLLSAGAADDLAKHIAAFKTSFGAFTFASPFMFADRTLVDLRVCARLPFLLLPCLL